MPIELESIGGIPLAACADALEPVGPLEDSHLWLTLSLDPETFCPDPPARPAIPEPTHLMVRVSECDSVDRARRSPTIARRSREDPAEAAISMHSIPMRRIRLTLDFSILRWSLGGCCDGNARLPPAAYLAAREALRTTHWSSSRAPKWAAGAFCE